MQDEEILSAIQVINKEFSDKEKIVQKNGNVLSYTALKLAGLKAYLMDVKEFAHAELLDAEIAMETAKGQAYLDAKKEHGATAASDIKNLNEDYIAAKKEYAQKKVYYEKIKSVVADTHDLIEALRSRIIDLQGARKAEEIR